MHHAHLASVFSHDSTSALTFSRRLRSASGDEAAGPSTLWPARLAVRLEASRGGASEGTRDVTRLSSGLREVDADGVLVLEDDMVGDGTNGLEMSW